MPITIKQNIFKYKNPTTGQYQSIDAVAETTTSEQIAAIEATGTTVLNSIPADYTTMSTDVSALKTKVGTVTLNTTNKDLSAATNELNGALSAITPRMPALQMDSVQQLASYVTHMNSSEIGIFSGKAAVGASLIGTSASCVVIAKYIASGNYATYLAFCGTNTPDGYMAYGIFSTTDYTVNIFETTYERSGTATDVYTGATCSVKKSWNNVQVSFTGDTTNRSFDSKGWKTLAVLPSGFRPSSLLQGFAVRLSTGTDVFRIGRITTGGNLDVYIGDVDVSVNFKGIGVFINFNI